jgi:hypothetical protein
LVSSSGHLSRQEQDTAEFERDILPKLVAVPIRALAAATGLSVGYCRRVKKGTMVGGTADVWRCMIAVLHRRRASLLDGRRVP